MSNKDKYYQNPQLQQLDIENILIDGINNRIEILELIDTSNYNVPNPRVIYEIEKQEQENKLRIEKEELQRKIVVAERLRKQKEEEDKIRRLQIEEEQRILEKELKAAIDKDNEERDKCREEVLTSHKLNFQLSLNTIVYRTQSKINSIIEKERSFESKLKLVEIGRNYLGKAKLIDEYYNKHFYDSDYRSNYDTRNISIIKMGLSSLKLDEGTIVKDSKRIIQLDEEEIVKYSEKIIHVEDKLSHK